MKKALMVVSGTVVFGEGSPVSGGAFVVTAVPSLTTRAESKFVYSGPLAWTFSGGSASGSVDGSVTGGGTISPAALKTKVDSMLVIREGDTGTGAFVGTNKEFPALQVSYAGVPVKVGTAGQSKVKGE